MHWKKGRIFFGLTSQVGLVHNEDIKENIGIMLMMWYFGVILSYELSCVVICDLI